jgi:hypothetical protein
LGEAASINVTLAEKSVGVLEKIVIDLMPSVLRIFACSSLLESFPLDWMCRIDARRHAMTKDCYAATQ